MLGAGDFLVGSAFLAVTLGACAVVAVVTVPRGLPGAPRAVALGLVGSAALVGVHVLAGAVGLLTREVVAVAALLVAGTAFRLRREPAPVAEPAEVEPADPLVSRVLAGAAALLVAGCALAFLRDVAGAPITSIDAQNFQVPVVARWIQDGHLWGLHQYIADYSNATYPQNGNVLVLAVVLPYESAFLARLVAVPFWALAALGVFALARELGAPRTAAALGATALAAVPVMAAVGLEAVQTDAPCLAWLAAGGLFLVRHHRTGRRADLVLAGLGLGLAFGTKWYAVPAVAIVLAVWALARRRAVGRDGAVLAGLVAAAGGFWLLRNLVQTGNPLFPQALGPLFPAPPDPLRDRAGFPLVHYAFDSDVWDTYLRPAFADTFGWTGAALAAGALVAGILAVRRRGPALAVAAAALALTALYFVLPYGAFGPEGRPVLAAASTRYALPALLAAAVLVAWATGRAGRARVAVEALLVLTVLDGVGRQFDDLSGAKMTGGIVAAAVLAGAVVLVARAPRRWFAAGLAATVVVGLAGADAVRRRANDRGYGELEPAVGWIERNAPSGHRIGLAGVWSTTGVAPPLPSFGPRLGNDVEYVGEFVEHMLRRYGRPERFRAALVERRLDLLVVGRGDPPGPPAREEEWAVAAGWTPVASTPRLVILRAAAPR